jgi:predicted phage tail protein
MEPSMTEQQIRVISPEQQFDFVALPGQTVNQLIKQLPDWQDHESYAVYNHGQFIADLDNYLVNDGDRLIICLVPQGGGGGGGGKGVLGIVAAVAIIAVAWWNPMGWAAAGGLLTTSSLYAVGAGLLLTSVGTMLAPKPELGTGNTTGSSQREVSNYFLTGQSNAARLYQPVLVAYGQNKMFPALAANPNVINVGKDSTFDALYDFGIGEQSYDLTQIKFGDALASQYSPTYYQHTNTKTPDLKLITNRFGYQDFAVRLDQNVPFTARTKDNTINAEVNIAFAQGLAYINDQGNNQNASVSMVVEWRAVGGSTWTPVRAGSFQGASVNQNGSAATRCQFGNIYDPFGQWTYDAGPLAYELDGRQVKNIAIGSVNLNGGNYQLLTFFEYEQAYDYEGQYLGEQWVYKQVVLMNDAELFTQGESVPAAPGNRYYWNRAYVPAIYSTPYNDVIISNATTSAFVVIAAIVFPVQGTYEVRITRLSANSTDNRRRDETTFTLLESRVAGNVLNLSAPHTMLEMRVKANERLSGTVQNLSVITTSVLNMYDELGNMVGRMPSRNPAWIAIDILTGAGNPRPIRHDQIDWPAWKRLADICDTPRTWIIGNQSITSARFTCDVVIDYETTVKQLIESVLSTCRSGLTIGLNGRYSVMYDGERTIPRQIITPSNSWNFSASRQFPAEVHALKVSFIDSGSDYKKQEVLVYNDGYNFDNAEKFEDVGTFGLTDYQHAWAFGRYMMAAAINRAEVFSVTMDVENLACQRGDLVQVAHDVPMVGGQPAYVMAINGSAIEVTETYSTAPNSYTVRLNDGTIRQGLLTAIINGNTFALDDITGIEVDNLIVLGQSQRLIKEYVVSQVSPSLDLSATLTLLPYIREVYDADIGALPEWRPELSEDLINATDLEITSVISSGQSFYYVRRMPYGKFLITWTTNNNLAAYFDLVVITADGNREIFTNITTSSYEYSIDLLEFPTRHGPVTFEVTPYTAGGIPGKPGSTIDVIAPDTTAPAGVNWFLVNVQDMEIALAWEPPQEPDIMEYEIRYSPKVVGASWNASQLIGKFPHDVTRTMVGARTGTYGIIVRDTSGNTSDITGKRTTIEFLPNINLIDTVNDAPTWDGTLGGIVLEGGSPSSAGDWGSVAPEGFYYYKTIFDAGYVYELRIVSKIQSHGTKFDDLIVNWVPLASAIPLSRAQSSQFNTMLEVRTSDEVSFINEWNPLASAIPIGGARPDSWSIWRPCEVGDFTGRLFQFRLRMQSFDPFVKAVIDDGLIEIDVRDRIDRFNNLIVPPIGITVNFDPAFMEPPTLAITTENSQAVRYEVTNKSRIGFDIDLFDEAGNAVAGQIDVLALGYGREKPTRI